jgi:hypothetical protein
LVFRNIVNLSSNSKFLLSENIVKNMACLPQFRLMLYYYKDWITILCLLVLVVIFQFVPTYQRYYFQNDDSISYPHKQTQTVPSWALFIIAFAVPLSVIVVLKLGFRLGNTALQLHHAILGLCLSVGSTGALTQIIKVTPKTI